MAISRSKVARFLEKVDPGPERDACWEWTANRAWSGYGLFWVSPKMVSAHREAYRIFRGRIPERRCVCHRCDNRGCVNPDHLFLGTRQDNMDDMVAKGRSPRRLGEKNHAAKVTASDALAIRARAGRGEVQRRLAEEYGISTASLSKIVLRQSWQHV